MTAVEIYENGELHYDDPATTPSFGETKKTSSTYEMQQIVVDYQEEWFLVVCRVNYSEVQSYPNLGKRLVNSIIPQSFTKIG